MELNIIENKKILDIFQKVLEENFDEFIRENIKFKLLFFDKKKNNTVAQIKKLTNITKFFSADENADEGYNYLILCDKKVFDILEDADIYRVLRHELRHVDLKYKKSGDVSFNLRKHTIEDFYEDVEIESNSGDIRWKERISDIIQSIYDTDEDL